MVKFKVVISDPKSGKSFQKEVDSTEVTSFKRKKIGDKVEGKALGYDGYEFEITGGSDTSGFPMRRDVDGIARKRILIVSGVGLRETRKGTRRRKLVRGNTISLNTAQINMKVVKYGKSSLDTEKKEEVSESTDIKQEVKEQKKEEKKEEPKEDKKKDKKEVKPEEEKKEEPKEDKKKDKKEVKPEEEKKEELKQEKTKEKKEA